MIRTFVVAAALGLSVLSMTPEPARADVNIDIHLGYGGFYGRNISCYHGRRIVERRFNRVYAVDCQGSTYVYHGRRDGRRYIIYVDGRRGFIKRVERLRR